MAVIGLDMGSTGCKASVFTPDGTLIDSVYREYPKRAELGERMFFAEDLFSAAMEVLSGACAKHPDVTALGVTSFGESFACLDQNDRVLFPSFLYTDPHGGEEAEFLAGKIGRETLTAAVGIAPHSMFSLPKLLYLKRQNETAFSGVRRILLMQDFLVYRLTGEAMIEEALASRTMGYDVGAHTWYRPVWEAAGIDPAMLSRPVPAGTVAGKLRPALAKEWNLPREMTVVVAAQDQIAAALGAGVLHAGEAVDGCGTVECVTPVFRWGEEPFPLCREGFPLVPFPGRERLHATYALSYSHGSALKWFRDRFGGQFCEAAAKAGENVYAYLDARIPTEPTKILVMPHFGGAATPYMDPHSRAAVLGLTLESTAFDLYRAIMEGCAMEMRISLERLSAAGIPVRQLVATGGGAQKAWLQIKADVFGLPMTRLTATDGGCAGTAMLAAVGGGLYQNPEAAAEAFVRRGETYEPDPERQKIYEEQFAHYREIYSAVRHLMES